MDWNWAIQQVIKYQSVDCVYLTNILTNECRNIAPRIIIDYSIAGSILFHNYCTEYMLLNYSSANLISNSMINFVLVTGLEKREYIININNSGASVFYSAFVGCITLLQKSYNTGKCKRVRIKSDIPKELRNAIKIICNRIKHNNANIYDYSCELLKDFHIVLHNVCSKHKVLNVNNILYIYREFDNDIVGTISVSGNIIGDGFHLLLFESIYTDIYASLYPKRGIEEISTFYNSIMFIMASTYTDDN